MAAKVKKVKIDPNVVGRRRRAAIIGLALFLVFDALLVAFAASAANTPRSESGVAIASVAPTPTATSIPTSTPTSTASASPTSRPIADAVVPSRVLAALDGNTAWRATTGACPASRATIELTSDGGSNWKRTDPSGPTGASMILAITAQSAKQASAIALTSQGCSAEFIRTYVAGDNWAAYATELSSAWYIEPGVNGKVHAPGGEVAVPCPAVVDLAVGTNSSAAVLCTGHQIYRTSDNGAHWDTTPPLGGAVTISPLGSGVGYAVAEVGDAGCGGVQILALDGAGNANRRACVGSTPPSDGTVALSGGGGALWLWVGDAIAKSSDGGTTWH